MSYTPINEHKLSKSGKEFLKECKRMRTFNVKNIYVPPQIFSDLLESMSPSTKSYYSDSIPFEDKLLVRK